MVTVSEQLGVEVHCRFFLIRLSQCQQLEAQFHRFVVLIIELNILPLL